MRRVDLMFSSLLVTSCFHASIAPTPLCTLSLLYSRPGARTGKTFLIDVDPPNGHQVFLTPPRKLDA